MLYFCIVCRKQLSAGDFARKQRKRNIGKCCRACAAQTGEQQLHLFRLRESRGLQDGKKRKCGSVSVPVPKPHQGAEMGSGLALVNEFTKVFELNEVGLIERLYREHWRPEYDAAFVQYKGLVRVPAVPDRALPVENQHDFVTTIRPLPHATQIPFSVLTAPQPRQYYSQFSFVDAPGVTPYHEVAYCCFGTPQQLYISSMVITLHRHSVGTMLMNPEGSAWRVLRLPDYLNEDECKRGNIIFSELVQVAEPCVRGVGTAAVYKSFVPCGLKSENSTKVAMPHAALPKTHPDDDKLRDPMVVATRYVQVYSALRAFFKTAIWPKVAATVPFLFDPIADWLVQNDLGSVRALCCVADCVVSCAVCARVCSL